MFPLSPREASKTQSSLNNSLADNIRNEKNRKFKYIAAQENTDRDEQMNVHTKVEFERKRNAFSFN